MGRSPVEEYLFPGEAVSFLLPKVGACLGSLSDDGVRVDEARAFTASVAITDRRVLIFTGKEDAREGDRSLPSGDIALDEAFATGELRRRLAALPSMSAPKSPFAGRGARGLWLHHTTLRLLTGAGVMTQRRVFSAHDAGIWLGVANISLIRATYDQKSGFGYRIASAFTPSQLTEGWSIAYKPKENPEISYEAAVGRLVDRAAALQPRVDALRQLASSEARDIASPP